MGHSSTLRALAACLLVGSVALAQQGLITEPWPQAAPLVSAPVVEAPRAMPASGLPPVAVAPAPKATVAPVASASQGTEAAPTKWTPPVVTLLVDPWKRTAIAPPPPRPRWLPQTPEIIDPWAHERPAEPPRVASRPVEPPRATIF